MGFPVQGAAAAVLYLLYSIYSLHSLYLLYYFTQARLLRYLSRGERQRYQQDNAELLLALRETPNVTLAKYECEREKLLPNGRPTLEMYLLTLYVLAYGHGWEAGRLTLEMYLLTVYVTCLRL